jgi:hypothetical protein
MRNLAKARANDESRMIRRYVFLWHTGHGQKPSGRAWARSLGTLVAQVKTREVLCRPVVNGAAFDLVSIRLAASNCNLLQ